MVIGPFLLVAVKNILSPLEENEQLKMSDTNTKTANLITPCI